MFSFEEDKPETYPPSTFPPTNFFFLCNENGTKTDAGHCDGDFEEIYNCYNGQSSYKSADFKYPMHHLAQSLKTL